MLDIPDPIVNRILTTVGEDGVRIGVMAVANPSAWFVVLAYDKQTLWTAADSMKENLGEHFLKKISGHLQQSQLPEVDNFGYEQIVIPFYAGRCLAYAIDRYLYAFAERYKPFKSWPETGKIPKYPFITYMPQPYMFSEPRHEISEVLNGILTYPRSSNEVDFHVLHSRVQWEMYLSTPGHGLRREEVSDIRREVEQSYLAEESVVEPVSLSGAAAWFFNRVLRYDICLSHLVYPFCDVPWRNKTDDGLFIN